MLRMINKMKIEIDSRAGNSMDKFLQSVVEQYKNDDETFERTGIEGDEFEENLGYYMEQDSIIKKDMQDFMQQLKATN